MIVAVIPFFLLARLATDDPVWENGPEFKFFTKIDVELRDDLVLFDEVRGYNLTNYMYCRPKSNDTFRCFLREIKYYEDFYDFSSNSVYSQEQEDEYTKTQFENIPFEVTFAKEGVARYAMTKNFTRDLREDYIKIQTNLLSIGTDFRSTLYTQFQAKENFFLGNCLTNFSVQYKTANSTDEDKFVLGLDFPLNTYPGISVKIIKTKNLDNCETYHNFFMAEIIQRNISRDARIIMKKYTNEIDLTNHDFVSKTHLHAVTATYFEITENYMIRLEDIRPVQENIPEVEDTTFVEIVNN